MISQSRYIHSWRQVESHGSPTEDSCGIACAARVLDVVFSDEST